MTRKITWSVALLAGFSLMLVFSLPSLNVTNQTALNNEPNPAASYTLPFTPVVSDADSPVGNITVTGLHFLAGISYAFGGNVSVKWDNGTFNETTISASFDTTTGSGASRSATIQFSWFEYLEISKTSLYSNPWVNYSSRVPRASLLAVEYNKSAPGWGNLFTAPSDYYQYYLNQSFTPNRYFLNLSLEAMNSYWTSITQNATVFVRIKYSYQIQISTWQVTQNSTGSIFLPELANNITQSFYESLTVYNSELITTELLDGVPTGVSILNMTLAYTPYYLDRVKSPSLWTCPYSSSSYRHITSSKEYNITNTNINAIAWIANASANFRVYFNANFTIQFEQAYNTPIPYAVDRLASSTYVREHWYYLHVVDGPSLLRISNLEFNDTNVAYKDTITASTYFGRTITKATNNVTVDGTSMNKGTKLTSSYLVAGETDSLILQYRAQANLTILIADDIYTPMVGAKVTLYRDGARYGSYLSLAESYILSAKVTDTRGIVIFTHLPSYGNYSIQVEYNGIDYGFYNVDQATTTNLLATRIPHLPTWVILWTSMCGIIFIVGFWKYRQYRKVPDTAM